MQDTVMVPHAPVSVCCSEALAHLRQDLESDPSCDPSWLHDAKPCMPVFFSKLSTGVPLPQARARLRQDLMFRIQSLR